MAQVEAPGTVFGFMRDALNQQPYTYHNCRDPAVTRIRAALLRRKLKKHVDLWNIDEQQVELTREEIGLLWSAVSKRLFNAASDKERRDAQRASKVLFFAER